MSGENLPLTFPSPELFLPRLIMQINTALTALGNLLAQIQADNPQWSAVTENILSVKSVSAVTADAEGRNTVVVVGADGYADTESFTFTRLGLGDNVNPAPTSIALQGTETAADIAALVAKTLGLVQSEVSFGAGFINSDGTIALPTAAADGSVTSSIAITSATGSLLYADGSTLSLTVNFPSQPVTPPVTPPAPTLAALTTQTNLSGFTAAPAPAPAASTDGTSTQPASTEPVAPAADGTTTTPAAPAADGTAAAGTTTDTPAAPAADAGTTTPAAPAAADGTAAAPTDTPAAPAAAADGTQTQAQAS